MIANYTPRGVCSRNINIEIDDDTHIIKHVAFTGGCHGNTQGISILVQDMKAEDAISKLEGINCNGKGTSCPDQLAKGLKAMLDHMNK